MRGLLYKDILLSIRLIIIFAFLVLGVTIGFFFFAPEIGTNPEAIYLSKCILFYVPFFLASMCNGENLKEDEKRVWCSFVISSPQAVGGQILSKYILLLIENLFIFVLCLAGDFICCVAYGGIETSVWKIMLIFVALNINLNAIEVPFMVRFGTSRGMQIKGSIFAVVFCAATIYFLFGDLSFFREHNGIDFSLELATSSIDLTKICIVMWIVSIILYAISYYISTLLYRAGVEAYEN
ncbi:MAG: ABC-2 transporter permease [Oscillospiraceae bacterium]|nr:ABC-2 transporter permease [Oscillospiraceae bacterium]